MDPNARCIALLQVLLGFSISTVLAGGNVTVNITFISYSNPSERDVYGILCEAIVGECDTIFHICLDLPTGSLSPTLLAFKTEDGQCAYGTMTSSTFSDHSPTFHQDKDGDGFENPIELKIPQWQDGLQVKVVAYDKDTATPNDVIDIILYEYKEPPARNLEEAGDGKDVILDGIRKQYTTKIHFNILVYCTENYYYGVDSDPCAVYCKGENSSIGHYECSETGEIICLPGWKNASSNCLTPDGTRLPDMGPKKEETDTGDRINIGRSSSTANFFGQNSNLIIGLIVGLFLLLLLIIILIAMLYRSKKKRKQNDQATNATAMTASAGLQAAPITTTVASGGATSNQHNPLYDHQEAPARADRAAGGIEPTYSEIDYGLIKTPLPSDVAVSPAASAKAREASSEDSSSQQRHYDRNLKYKPQNTKASPLMHNDSSQQHRYPPHPNGRAAVGGLLEQGAVGGATRDHGVRGGFSPMGQDSATMYGFQDSQFHNPTYEEVERDIPGKVSVVKMAGMYEEPIKVKKM